MNTISSPLNQNDWSKMYRETEYKNKTNRAKNFALHFILALNQSDKTVLPFIKTLQNKSPGRLSVQDPQNHKLTPLIIATMKGRENVVYSLLESLEKSKINSRDTYGWTALHHASISSSNIFEMLLKHGADIKSKTNMMGTCFDLMELTQRNIKSTSIDTVSYRTSEGNLIKISDLTRNTFEKHLGLLKYRDIPLYTKPALKALWQQQPDPYDLKLAQILKIKQDLLKKYYINPPKLTICESKLLKGQSVKILGLHAGEKITCGQIIGTYGGFVHERKRDIRSFKNRFNEENVSKRYYLSSNLDAEKVGDATRYTNWGWPNAVMTSIPYKGVTRSILVAADPAGIEKGEEILWDYSINETALAFGKQVILRRDKMRSFFSKGLEKALTKFDTLTHKFEDELSQNKLTPLTFFQYAICQQRIQFPLNVPGALLDLHFSGIVNCNEWFKKVFCSQNLIFIQWRNHFSTLAKYVDSMLNRIIEFEDRIKSHQELKKLAGQWVIDQIGTLSVMQILKGLEIITNTQSTLTKENWPNFNNSLTNYLEKYDWKADENAPLGYKRTSDDLLFEHILYPKEKSLRIVEIQLNELKGLFPDGDHEFIKKFEWIKECIKKTPASLFGNMDVTVQLPY